MRYTATEATKIVVFDLEWNMSGPREAVPQAVKTAIPYEIIEIGAIRLDSGGHYEQTFNALVKPEVYPKLNPYVARVTNRAKESIRYGLPFPQAYRNFAQFCGDDYIFATWSDSDSMPLKQNLAWHGFNDQLQTRVVNVQRAFTRIAEPGSPQRSVEYALDFLQLAKDQPFHQAVSDAWYTGKVLEVLLRQWDGDIATFVSEFSYNPDIRLSLQDKLEPQDSREALESILAAYEAFCPACGRPLSLVEEAPELDEDEDDEGPVRKPERTWRDEQPETGGQTAMARALAEAMAASGGSIEGSSQQTDQPPTEQMNEAEAENSPEPRTIGPWTGYSKKLRAVWSCPEHGLISGRVRIRRAKTKYWHATVTLRLVRS